MRYLIKTIAATIILPVFCFSASQAQESAAGATGTATLTGTVKLTGAKPAMKAISMASDPVCAGAHSALAHEESAVVGEGGELKWVFVHVKEGVSGSYPVPKTPVVLDQVGCTYMPHVFGVQAKQKIEIRNSDATLHNVHALPKNNREFNLGMPMQGMKLKKKFTRPEVMVKIKCDVHSWMSCYVGVLSHPFYAVSGEDGAFSIGELPAGTYTIEAWHETFGTQTQSVTIGGGETKSIDFAFSG